MLVVEHLQELNFGDWKGMTWQEVELQYHQAFHYWKAHRLHTKVPNGESYYDMIKRVQQALSRS